MANTLVRGKLTPEELQAARDYKFYVPGRPYLWVLSYGWCMVGFYVEHTTPLRIRVEHGNYYRNAHKSHAELAREGPKPETEWRYVGRDEISFHHVIHVFEYMADVPRDMIKQEGQ